MKPPQHSDPFAISRQPTSGPLSAFSLPSTSPPLDLSPIYSRSDDSKFIALTRIRRALVNPSQSWVQPRDIVGLVVPHLSSSEPILRRAALMVVHELFRDPTRIDPGTRDSIGAALLVTARADDIGIARDALGALCLHSCYLSSSLARSLGALLTERLGDFDLGSLSKEEKRIVSHARRAAQNDEDVLFGMVEAFRTELISGSPRLAAYGVDAFLQFSDLIPPFTLKSLVRDPLLPPRSYLLLCYYLPYEASMTLCRVALRRLVRTLDGIFAAGVPNEETKDLGKSAVEQLLCIRGSARGAKSAVKEFLFAARHAQREETVALIIPLVCEIEGGSGQELLQDEIRSFRPLSALRKPQQDRLNSIADLASSWIPQRDTE